MEASLYRQVRALSLKCPTRPALMDSTTTYTYAEVCARAQALGHRLADLGIGPGHRVGVMMRRSVDLVVALLGVSAAGAAYVPLDPDYPPQRLRAIVADADLSVLVGDSIGPEFDLPVVSVSCSATAATFDLPVPSPRDPAYLIYTSGSTGHPKGVIVTNANVAALFDALDRMWGVPDGDRFLAVTSFSFDIALVELIWPLTRGGSTVVGPAKMINRLDPGGTDSLPDLVRRFQPSLLQATPSLFAAIASYERTLHSMRSLRGLFVGGEVFPPGLASRLAGALPGVRVFNLYGPTEATVWCTAYELPPATALGTAISIGRPLGHADTRIVAENGTDAATGDAGELWIGGPCVAEGYFRAPELTRDRFVEHAGQRWYRTGDRARTGPDGELEFIGRLDRQVKVLGVRIELDEIEAALSTSPDVASAAVILRPAANGEDQLIAYVKRQRSSTMDHDCPPPDESRTPMPDR